MPVSLPAKACRISCSVGNSSLSVSTEKPNQKAWLYVLDIFKKKEHRVEDQSPDWSLSISSQIRRSSSSEYPSNSACCHSVPSQGSSSSSESRRDSLGSMKE